MLAHGEDYQVFLSLEERRGREERAGEDRAGEDRRGERRRKENRKRGREEKRREEKKRMLGAFLNASPDKVAVVGKAAVIAIVAVKNKALR